MSAENVKWRVNRAVRKSNLPPTARLIMWTLSDMADAKTGVIPQDKRKLSLTVLAEETGLGESTVKTQLANLEQLGWVIRTRPDLKARGHYATTAYRIQAGDAGDERQKFTREKARSKPSADVGEGQDVAPSDESQDLGEGQEQAPRGPGAIHLGARSKPSYIEEDDQDDQDDPFLGPNADASAPSTGPKKRTGKPKAEAPPRPDVDALCQRLAELMIANECKPPTITQAWRDEARRLLDLDNRPFDKAMSLLEWCQNDFFWKSNIHSMTKFRAQYDQLRQRANAEWEQRRRATTGGHQPYDNPTDPNAYSGGIQ